MAAKRELPAFAAPVIAAPYKVSLHSQERGSDKVYHIEIALAGDRYMVLYANGRAGGSLQYGQKTQAPVDYSAAREIANKVLMEKLRDGYLPQGGGQVIAEYVRPSETGIRPQLLEAASENELPTLLSSNRHAAQEKHDGTRLMILVNLDASVIGINKRGLQTPIPPRIKDIFFKMCLRPTLIDGELIGDNFHAFDALKLDGEDIQEQGFSSRYKQMVELLGNFAHLVGDLAPHGVHISKAAFATEEKTALYHSLKEQGREGLVFKVVSAPYTPSRTPDQLKVKFWNSLSAVVTEVGDGKRSVGISLLDAGEPVAIGNVTIPVNYPVPRVGSVVEVRYLYAYEGGALAQPIYLGERHDTAVEECVAGQRVFEPKSTKRAAASMSLG